MGSLVGAVIRCLGRWFGQSVEEAAATAVYLASSPEVCEREMRGGYYVPIAKGEEPTRLGRDGGLAREVWVCLNFFDYSGGCYANRLI